MERFLLPAGIGAAVFMGGLLVRWVLLARLHRWASRTRWTWDDLLLAALKGPSALWCLMAGIHAAVLASPASDRFDQLSAQGLSVLWLLSATLIGLKVADQLIQRYGERFSSTLPLTTLTQNLAKGAILVVGGLMALNSFGISITPLLTALGVGGLAVAVALALQETLANLFAGIYLTVARKIRVGDYIKLDSGEEGHVADIAWRSTRVRTLSNNLVVIPNTKLAQAVVTNYDLPSSDLAVLMEVGVDYRSDQYLVKHEFIKRLHRRYAQEGIVIPFPIQTVITEPGGASPTPS